MGILELIFLSVALAMDAFSVSITQGMSCHTKTSKLALTLAFFFGLFQALMPLLGYFLGANLSFIVSSIDHWIAFILLAFIGIKMAKESFEDDDEQENSCSVITIKQIIILSIATSIDAFAAGITLALMNVNVFFSISIIGIITAVFCFVGVFIGHTFKKIPLNMELIGGIFLIGLGCKILVEHLGIL